MIMNFKAYIKNIEAKSSKAMNNYTEQQARKA
jgi:hypothetical protein